MVPASCLSNGGGGVEGGRVGGWNPLEFLRTLDFKGGTPYPFLTVWLAAGESEGTVVLWGFRNHFLPGQWSPWPLCD